MGVNMEDLTTSVSTITPVYSGAAYLEKLVEEIFQIKVSWENQKAPMRITESIFVVDSAIDNSESILNELKKKYHWVKVITLSKNFGQHPATMAGVLHSSGDWIITLDEDLQHHPKYFQKLFKRVSETSADLVYAKPETVVHQALTRDLPAKTFKKTMSFLTGNKFITEFNSFRLMRGTVARAAASVCSHETYYDIAICWFTNRIHSETFPLVDQRYVALGKSGYSFFKLLSHARRLLVSTQQKYLRVGAWMGFIAVVFSILFGIYVLIQKIINPASVMVQGWTSLFLSIFFWGGVSSILLSLLIEFLGNISLHIQGKPVFFVVDRSHDEILKQYFSASRTE